MGGEATPSCGNPRNHLIAPPQGALIRGLGLQASPTRSACRATSKGQTVVRKGSGRSGRPAHHCIALYGCSTWPLLTPVSPEGNDNRTVCKEIRHNSTGCLRMKDQCAKCQEILSVGESGSRGSLVPQWGCLYGSASWEFKFQLCCSPAVAPEQVLCLLLPGPLICRQGFGCRVVPEVWK